jgi:predicted NUDIX family phosphoesterase
VFGSLSNSRRDGFTKFYSCLRRVDPETTQQTVQVICLVFIKHLEKIRIWIVLSDGMHNVVGQLHIDAIYHIEDKNRFDHLETIS